MIPDLLIEQLHLGELDAKTAAQVRAALDAGATGLDATGLDAAARLADLAAQDAMSRAQYPASLIVPRIEARMPAPRRWWPVVLPSILAATAGLWLAARPTSTFDPQAQSLASKDTVRAKGPLRPVLQVMRAEATQAGAKPSAVQLTESLAAGDRIQLRFLPRGAHHAVIVSVDGRGATTLHVPDSVDESTALATGDQRLTVGHAYELDDAPDYERFFLITSDEPLDPDALLSAAAQAGAGDLKPPAGARVDAFTLRKSK